MSPNVFNKKESMIMMSLRQINQLQVYLAMIIVAL